MCLYYILVFILYYVFILLVLNAFNFRVGVTHLQFIQALKHNQFNLTFICLVADKINTSFVTGTSF